MLVPTVLEAWVLTVPLGVPNSCQVLPVRCLCAICAYYYYKALHVVRI